MYSQDPRYRPMVRAGALPAASLLAMVLGITAVGFAITGLAAYLTQSIGLPVSGPFSLIFMLISFGLIFAISANRANPSLALTLFYIFTAVEGIFIGPIIAYYARVAGGEIVFNAALTTGVGMAVLGGIVYASSFDFRKLSSFAFAALIGLMIVGVLGMFVHIVHPGTYAWATLAIFSLLVLVDFGRIKAGGDGLTPVEMAISIYLDAINIFIALLEIFGIRTRSD